MRRHSATVTLAAVLCAVTIVTAQRQASSREMADAERDVPLLADVLELQPGMTVADVGAGFGAMSIVLAKHLGASGRVLSTDIGANQLRVLREAVTREQLTNMTVIEGAPASTNLPDACCDAIFMRDVYHHITEVAAFNRSLAAALKPGGRLAIIDFEPRKGSRVPEGVSPNRGGHGITPAIVEEEVPRSGLTFERRLPQWPPGSTDFFLVLFKKPVTNLAQRNCLDCRSRVLYKVSALSGLLRAPLARPRTRPGSSAAAITS